MRKLLCLIFLSSAVSGCVSIPNTKGCTVAGVLAAGLNCGETQKPDTCEAPLDETIDFLEPQEERTCVPSACLPGVCAVDQTTGAPVKLPKRAGAIIMSAEDWSKLKTAMDKACRELGNKCSKAKPPKVKKIEQAAAAHHQAAGR